MHAVSAIENNFHLAIIGTGGFAREVLCLAMDIMGDGNAAHDRITFYERAENIHTTEIHGFPVIPLGDLNLDTCRVTVAIGDPTIRARVVEEELAGASFATLIHPKAILSPFVEIGEGSIICAGVIVTCEISIGRHAQLNLHSDIGHDCRIGDFFTTAPGARISGNCQIGDYVYIGTNASVKQGISIADRTTIGMGCVVVKDIQESGVYIGNPARLLRR